MIEILKAASSRLFAAIGTNGRTYDAVDTPDAAPGNTTVRQVGYGGITAFFIYGAGYALTYCSQLIIARIAGVDNYGVYAYVFAWIMVLVYFSSLGFDVA